MKILVTGGSGNVGRGVVARLVRSGHEVRVLDWKTGERKAGAAYMEGDITHFETVREQVRGVDGIVHLAAYPNPMSAPGTEIFRVNCMGTFNVFEAAAAEGIRRVACASSINALGYSFGVKSFPVAYFPVDEAHPTFTTDAYSFSKQTTEAIASYYWRRDGISSACLRMPYVYSMYEMPDDWNLSMIDGYKRAFQKLLDMDKAERNAQVRRVIDGFNELRATRIFEKPFEGEWGGFDPEDAAMMAFFGYHDFWSIISVEDAAQAFEKALLAEFEGSHALFVSEHENTTGVEAEKLLEVFYPEVTMRKRPIPGRSTLLSYERARQLIGYEPEYLLRERLGS